jgi:REP element-mobilizing transposase RayT
MPSCEAVANRLFSGEENISSRRHIFFVVQFHERRLPHLYQVGRPLFVTWRLFGSLPRNRRFPELTSGEAFVAMDRILDSAKTGPRYLAMAEISQMVTEAILCRDQRQYELHAFVVMANHVHLLITPMLHVARIMHSLKRYTAAEANRILGRTGQRFWQEESYDRLVRDGREFDRIRNYIDNNPVKAGVVSRPEDYCWSSARRD